MANTPFEQLQSMIEKRQQELYRTINRDYRATINQIESEVDQIIEIAEYDEEGNLKNEKTINDRLKKIAPIIAMLWLKNKTNIEVASTDIMRETILFYEFLSVKQLGNTRVIQTVPEINRMVSSILTERNGIIKWDQVIRGNSRVLDRRLQKIVQKDIAKGKTKLQIERNIQKTMQLNSGKAKTIARTESNYYSSRSKYLTGKIHEAEGNIIIKQWDYTFLSREPRYAHQMAHGQTVVGIDNKFIVGGRETVAPQQFGIAEEDINCTCMYIIRYAEDTEVISYREYGTYKESKYET